MRQVLSLLGLLAALASSDANPKINAPVPNSPPPPSIDGKYALLAIYNGAGPVGKGGFGVAGGGPGGAFGVEGSLIRTPRGEATTTKNEITIERPALNATIVMEYTLNTTKTPITIDVETIPLRGKKTKSLGIVEINGNHSIIALAKEGDERPKTTDEAVGATIYYFQKAPPPAAHRVSHCAMTVGKEEAAEKELNKLAQEGFEFVSTTQPVAADAKSSVTTVHFLLKRTVKQP
jgi:uncharacterized protein (TIGR03067 family)